MYYVYRNEKLTVREIMDIVSYDEIIKFNEGEYKLTEKDRSEILKIYKKLEEAKKTPPGVAYNHSIVVFDSRNYDTYFAAIRGIRGGTPLFEYPFEDYINMMVFNDTSKKSGMTLQELFLIILLSMRAQYASLDEKLPRLYDEYIYQCKNGWKECNE